MKKILSILALLALVCASAFCLFGSIGTQQPVSAASAPVTQYSAFGYMKNFTAQHPKRVAGTAQSKAAGDTLIAYFASLGYNVSESGFAFNNGTENCTGRNIVARMRSKNSSGVQPINTPMGYTQIIIGAHYDNVGMGSGASDNGSGIGALMDIAAKLAGRPLPFDVVLIAFDAEEYGLFGSADYASKMSANEIASTLVMINLDVISNGDFLYCFAEDVNTRFNDFFIRRINAKAAGTSAVVKHKPVALDIIKTTTMTHLTGVPYYHTGQASDNSSFRRVGIPSVFIFSGRYTLGYSENAARLESMHTNDDTSEYIEQHFSEAAKQRMQAASDGIVLAVCDAQFVAVMSGARGEMVADIFYKAWPAVLLCAVALTVLCGLGGMHLQKLKKLQILNDIAEPPAWAVEKPKNVAEEDIFPFLKG